MQTDNNTYINEIELYMEGIKIPTFSSIQISEALNATPAALITFLNTVDVLKLLPGTVVQIFAKRRVYKNTGKEIYGGEGKTILLFEGEIVTISFAYSPLGNMLSIRAVPVISKMLKARMRPNHVLLKQDQRDAESMNNSKFNLSVLYEDPVDKDKKINQGQNSIDGFKTYDPDKGKEATKFDNKDNKQPEKEYSGKISDIYKENDISIFSTYIADKLNNDPEASNGNYNKLFQRFNFQFEKFDLYYGLCSGSFKIGPSLLALNNLRGSSKLANLIFQKAFSDFLKASSEKATDSTDQYNLLDVFNLLQQHIQYQSIMFASPLSLVTKHLNKDNTKATPIRMLLMPSIDSGPPIMSNVWFPNQISSASFERDLVNEPTRLIGIMDYTQVTGMNAMPEFLNPIFVAPDLDIVTTTGKIKDKKVADLSFEECYRGITLRESTYTGAVLKTLQNIAVGKEKQDINFDKPSVETWKKFAQKSEIEKKQEVDQVLKSFTLQEYNKLKYGQRMLNIVAEWSPYRILGLPGGVMLENGLSVIGIVQAINTSISSDGKIGSNVLLSYVRCVYDDDFEDEDDYKTIIQTEGTLADSFYDNHFVKDLVPDFSREGILGANPYAFEQGTWGFSNIGKNVYAQFRNGKTEEKADFSLLKFFKSEDVDNKSDIKILNSVGAPEFENYITLKYCFRKLRENYTNTADNDRQTFVETENRRSVLTKTEYENYLGITFDKIGTEYHKYTKDTFKILKSQETDLTQTEILQGANIKASTFNTVVDSKDLEDVFDKYTNLKQKPFTEFTSINNIYDSVSDTSVKSLYKLYDRHRQAHVRNLLTKLNRENINEFTN